MTLSRSPQCRAFSRAVIDEKSLSPLFSVGVWGGGGGASGRSSYKAMHYSVILYSLGGLIVCFYTM